MEAAEYKYNTFSAAFVEQSTMVSKEVWNCGAVFIIISPAPSGVKEAWEVVDISDSRIYTCIMCDEDYNVCIMTIDHGY